MDLKLSMDFKEFVSSLHANWLHDQFITQRSPEDWWLFIKPDFKRIFRPVNHRLWKYYESGFPHGRLSSECFYIRSSTVNIILPLCYEDKQDEPTCFLNDYEDIVYLMDYMITFPYRHYTPQQFNIPPDLLEFMTYGKNKVAAFLKGGVKMEFLMDIPFLWSPSERISFLRKVDYFYIRYRNICLPVYRYLERKWVREDFEPCADIVLTSMMKSRKYVCKKFIFRLLRNILQHYLEDFENIYKDILIYDGFWVPNEFEIERLVTHLCPYFECLYEKFRTAIIDYFSKAYRLVQYRETFQSIQKGFLSTTSHFEEGEASGDYWMEKDQNYIQRLMMKEKGTRVRECQ